MISKIEIKNFKQIENEIVVFDQNNVIVGPNNSGKSTILQAIYFASSVAQTTSMFNNGKALKDHDIVSFQISDFIYTPVNQPNALRRGGYFPQKQSISIEISIWEDTTKSSMTIVKGKNDNLQITFNGVDFFNKSRKIASPYSIFVPGLAGIAKQENFINQGSLYRMLARGDANLALRNIVYLLDSKDKLAKLNECVSEIYENTDITIDSDPDQDEHIELSATVNGSKLPLYSAATGLLQTIQILGYVLFFQPQILLLDEPDSHLHPSHQRKLINTLINLQKEKEFQIIATTHSRHLLEEFKRHGKAILASKDKIKDAPDGISLLLSIGALDGLELINSNKPKFVVLTEDEETKYIDAIISSNKKIKKTDYLIYSYKGCSNILSAEILANFINASNPSIKILLHRDSDYFKDQELERLKKRFTDLNIIPFFTSGVDIESHFLNSDHLAHISTLSTEVCEEILSSVITEQTKQLKKAAKEGRLQIDKSNYNNGQPGEGTVAINKWVTGLDFDSQRRWVHGKKIIGLVISKLQQHTKTNIELAVPSRFIESKDIRSLIQL